MQIDYERLKARNYSGLTEEELQRFTRAVKYRVGGGKRSYVICLLVKQFTKIHEDSIARQGNLDQRVTFATDNAFRTLIDSDSPVNPDRPQAPVAYHERRQPIQNRIQ